MITSNKSRFVLFFHRLNGEFNVLDTDVHIIKILKIGIMKIFYFAIYFLVKILMNMLRLYFNFISYFIDLFIDVSVVNEMGDIRLEFLEHKVKIIFESVVILDIGFYGIYFRINIIFKFGSEGAIFFL